MRSHLLCAIWVTLLGGVWAARAEEPQVVAPEREEAVAMKTTRGVRYHADEVADPERLSLDVYAPGTAVPEGSKGRPVMLFVHGGGWTFGDKEHVGRKPKYFTDAGWVFVATNYRFVPEGRHPVNVEDVARAVAWTRKNVAGHSGDPDSIFLMGHSAGAHLAALVATDGRHLAKAGESLDAVRGVVLLDGAGYDVPWRMENPGGKSLEALYRRAFGDDEELWIDASPVTHVKKDVGIPPFLVTYVASRLDAGIAARRLVATLRRADVRADIYPARGKTHATINRELGMPDDAVTLQMLAFLTEIWEQPRPRSKPAAETR